VSVTPGSALTAPSGLTPAPGPKAGEATLQWDNPNNSIITGYEYRIRIWDVQNDGQWIGGWSAYGGTDHTTVSIVFSGLRVNTFYEVQLRAVAGTVKGPAAAITVVPAESAITLAAPTGFNAVAGPGEGQVMLSWDNPGNSDIGDYQVRQGSGSPLTWGSWTDIGSSDHTTVKPHRHRPHRRHGVQFPHPRPHRPGPPTRAPRQDRGVEKLPSSGMIPTTPSSPPTNTAAENPIASGLGSGVAGLPTAAPTPPPSAWWSLG